MEVIGIRYLAHISEDKTREQALYDHLIGTAKLAGEFSSAFHCEGWGYGCGMMHDIGKYSDKFQKRLHGGSITDHATAGAKELYKRNIIAAYCISGHHSGLLDGGQSADVGGEATLCGRMQKKLENYQYFQTEVEVPNFPAIPLKQLGKGGFSLSFFIRMLFSCLVDADYLDTEMFMADGNVDRGDFDPVDILFERLFRHVKPWLQNTDKNTVNGRRTAILKASLEMGKRKKGLFQMTVPTGGGKTISSLAFGLCHAKEHRLNRVIYVIPYTSIIEQNAQVFKDILGEQNVLEDHCNVVYEDRDGELNLMQLAAENWDCPIVVTTNVQFFESLFASKTSKCRKLHNISNSVIIFDEAQMLPINYLRPCVQTISELVYNYQSSVVLCTATQPSLKQFFPSQMEISEICPDVKGQYNFFRRTSFKNAGELAKDQLSMGLREHSQVLCVLNSRRAVQQIYASLSNEKGIFHLSTFMYPKHRKRLLSVIRKRLQEGKPCKLISTSLVEAGVDFDFPTVYRELAGIDSMIQAAGRCNREGKRPRDMSKTVIFTLEKEENIRIPQSLKLPIEVANQVSEEYEDIASPEAIETYFKQLYYFKGESLDVKDIIGQMEEGVKSRLFPFATVSRQFRLIENDKKTIFIDKEPEAKQIVERIRRGEHSRQLVREAGQYCVSIYNNDFENLNGAGRLEAIEMDFYLLRNKEQYTEQKGFEIQVERGDAVMY